jgi:hypothetical protein
MTSKKDKKPFIHQAVLRLVSQGDALARQAIAGDGVRNL